MFEKRARASTTAPPAVSVMGVSGIDVSGIELSGLAALPRTPDHLVEIGTLIQWLVAHPAPSLRSDFDVLEHAALWERVRTFSAAQAVASVVEFARRPEAGDAADDRAARVPEGQVARHFPVDEVAARLAVSSYVADTQLSLGLALTGRLPLTRLAFVTGRLDLAKTRAVVDACTDLDADDAAAVEARVLDLAASQDLTKLRQRLRRAVLTVDPGGAEERRVKAQAERRVWLTPAEDGMAWLTALLPASDALTIEKAIDAAAHAGKAAADPGDSRTLEQRRADALVWPFTRALEQGALVGMSEVGLARHRGFRPQIQVTVAASTLQGLDDQPADLQGYGPITAQAARSIAAGGVWRRLVTDPWSGAVLDVGTTLYRPPAELARHIEVRDQTCRYPTCNRPANRGDLDHTDPFPSGRTAASNLAVLCRRHHLLKHATSPAGRTDEPRLCQPEPGTLEWSMPTGHRYVVRPPQVGPVDDAVSVRDQARDQARDRVAA